MNVKPTPYGVIGSVVAALALVSLTASGQFAREPIKSLVVGAMIGAAWPLVATASTVVVLSRHPAPPSDWCRL